MYGTESLTGPDSNPVNPAEEVTIPTSDSTLVLGQQEDADPGLYLGVSESQTPQPIPNSNGGTDPGPRTGQPPCRILSPYLQHPREHDLRRC